MDENTESKTIEKKRFSVKKSDSLKEKSINIIQDDNNQVKTKLINSVKSESFLDNNNNNNNNNNNETGIITSPIPYHPIGQNLLTSNSFQNLSIDTNTESLSSDGIHFSSIGSDFKSNYLAQPLNRSPTPTFPTTSVFNDGNIDSRHSSKSPPILLTPTPRSPSLDIVGNSDVILKKNRFIVKSITPSNSPALNSSNLISNNNNNNTSVSNLPLSSLPNQITVPTVQKRITPPVLSILPQQNEMNNNNLKTSSILENTTNQIQIPIQQISNQETLNSSSIIIEKTDNLNQSLKDAINSLEQLNISIDIPLKLKKINSLTSVTTPTILSPTSNQTNENDNIGKLTFANNEIKKELEVALKQNRDFHIECKILRERCQMLEEKFKIQNAKCVTLEEMFERGRITQKKLLSHIDVQQNTIDLLQKQILNYQSNQIIIPENDQLNNNISDIINNNNNNNNNIDVIDKNDSNT